MRVHRKHDLDERQLYSDAHRRRLEEQGHFPKRFKLNPTAGQQGAVAWDADKIDQWIADRAQATAADGQEVA